MGSVSLAWELKCQLGEGPAWFRGEQVLRFVDIKRGHIHAFDPATGVKDTFEVGGQPSFIVPEDGGGALVGSGLAIYRFASGRLGAPLFAIPDIEGNRTNDATVDLSGRLWFGTMDDQHSGKCGAVWCHDEAILHRAGAEAPITNGPAISPDGRWLYHVDTIKRLIWRYPLEGRTVLENGEVLVELEEQDGLPDGIVLDCEGCIWVGLWNGWGVRRYDQEGRLLEHIAMPCANVTKIAFAGPDLGTAYVTTARSGLDEERLRDQPLAGSLFTFDPGVAGLPLPNARKIEPADEATLNS